MRVQLSTDRGNALSMQPRSSEAAEICRVRHRNGNLTSAYYLKYPERIAQGGRVRVDDDAAGEKSIIGPSGRLTRADLPSSNTTHWTSRRKAELMAAIDGGLIDLAEAFKEYRLTSEELAAWRETVGRAGIPGLRVTRHTHALAPSDAPAEDRSMIAMYRYYPS
jgi:hypothetical protein